MSGTSSRSASTTTPTIRRRRSSGLQRERTSQTPAERRLSKTAAAINQKWRQTGNEGVKITADDLAGVWLRAAGKCQYCGIEVSLMTASFDHVVPFKNEGPSYVSNLACCCVTCQRSKHTKTPEEYATWQKLERHCRSCGTPFRPRWADYVRGYGWYHSRSCAAKASHA